MREAAKAFKALKAPKDSMVVFDLGSSVRAKIVTDEKEAARLRVKVGSMVRMVDDRGRAVNDSLLVLHVFEGGHLAHAKKRAERWGRKKERVGRGGPPRHIALKASAAGLQWEGIPAARAA